MASANDNKWSKDAADQNFDYMFKLLIIGNSSVGKTSFLFRYADDSFTSAFVSTVGIDFKVKTVFRQDKRVKLQIWVWSSFDNSSSTWHKCLFVLLVVSFKNRYDPAHWRCHGNGIHLSPDHQQCRYAIVTWQQNYLAVSYWRVELVLTRKWPGWARRCVVDAECPHTHHHSLA